MEECGRRTVRATLSEVKVFVFIFPGSRQPLGLFPFAVFDVGISYISLLGMS